MRLFIGLRPDEDSIKRIVLVQKDLAKVGSGRWIEKDNLHLTMAFLGEVKEEKISELKNILSAVSFAGCTASVNHIGAFQGKNGNLVFLGMEDNAELENAQRDLIELLRQHNYAVEDRQFLPHITIGRNLHMKMEIKGHLKKNIQIKLLRMHLYSSENIAGRRKYREL